MHNTGEWYLNPKCIRLFECECKCLFKDEMQDAFRKIDSAFGTGQASVFILCEGFFIPFTHLSNHHWWTNRLLVCNLICRVIANQNALSLSLCVWKIWLLVPNFLHFYFCGLILSYNEFKVVPNEVHALYHGVYMYGVAIKMTQTNL